MTIPTSLSNSKITDVAYRRKPCCRRNCGNSRGRSDEERWGHAQWEKVRAHFLPVELTTFPPTVVPASEPGPHREPRSAGKGAAHRVIPGQARDDARLVDVHLDNACYRATAHPLAIQACSALPALLWRTAHNSRMHP